jgi:hypothetical protein
MMLHNDMAPQFSYMVSAISPAPFCTAINDASRAVYRIANVVSEVLDFIKAWILKWRDLTKSRWITVWGNTDIESKDNGFLQNQAFMSPCRGSKFIVVHNHQATLFLSE